MTSRSRPRWKTLIFILQLVLIGVIVALWLGNRSFQAGRSLWVLFLYSFPAEFLIAAAPHEPVILFYGKFIPALTVALVSVAGTVLTEALNYSMFRYISDLKVTDRFQRSRWVRRLIDLFNRAPFAALWIAGFTPVPFYPFRFLVVMARYPLWKYLAAVLLSRTPRFFILAKVGEVIKIPDLWLIVIFAAMLLIIYLPILRKLRDIPKQDHAA
jgi:membrane protein YqaA with SNARE-associated domain